jgi:short subunit dehydrogenase-like uncharacterized protein
MSQARVMVYGASGFTARLILENLEQRGIAFIVAGRNEQRIRAVAEAFRSKMRVFDLDDAATVERGLRGIDVLLNAAGPFGATTAPLIRACLHEGTHYLDVSGEVRPLELLARLDEAGRARGVMLLPSIGFDVVPSDCLAVHLAKRLPGAQELTLSISGSDLLSRGSALTFADHAGVPVFTRKEGALEPVRFRAPLRWTDFGDGYRLTLATSWGDLVTAFRSTGIPNIEVHFEATMPRLMGVAGNQYFGWMFQSPFARTLFREMAERVPDGPTRETRERHGARIHGEARRGAERVRSLMVTSEAYTFTAISAGAVVERVLAGDLRPGFQTPAALFGADFALSLGATRQDLP